MSEETDAIFQVFQTTLEMIEDRGFFVSSTVKEQTQDDIKARWEQTVVDQGMVFIFDHQEENKKILVCFVKVGNTSTISSDDIRNFAKIMQEQKVFNGIILSSKNLSSQAERQIKDINIDNEYHIEYFKFDDLFVNISRHELVPKHLLVTDTEKKQVMKKYRVKESQLPKILVTDPMARYLGLRKGDLVKIIRNSQTAGIYIVYRICIQLIHQ